MNRFVDIYLEMSHYFQTRPSQCSLILQLSIERKFNKSNSRERFFLFIACMCSTNNCVSNISMHVIAFRCTDFPSIFRRRSTMAAGKASEYYCEFQIGGERAVASYCAQSAQRKRQPPNSGEAELSHGGNNHPRGKQWEERQLDKTVASCRTKRELARAIFIALSVGIKIKIRENIKGEMRTRESSLPHLGMVLDRQYGAGKFFQRCIRNFAGAKDFHDHV